MKACSRAEAETTKPVYLEDGGQAIAFEYGVPYHAFSITGDGNLCSLYKDFTESWTNGMHYTVTLNGKNAGKFRVHERKLAVCMDSRMVVFTRYPEDYRQVLCNLGYSESIEIWIPGAGGSECIPLVGGGFLH